MDGVPILAQLVDHLQALGSPVGLHKGNREGSCQGDRPIRDGERLLQGESEPKAGDLLNLRIHIIYEKTMEGVEEFSLELRT